MTAPDTLPLSSLLEELPRLPALVVGPGATSHAGIAEDIGRKVANAVGVSLPENRDLNYMSVLDASETQSVATRNKARDIAHRCLRNAEPSPAIRSLVSVRWSAIASLAPDTCLEDALRNKYDASPSSWDVTVVDSAEVVPMRRSVPIYKLLGDPRDQRENYGPVLDSSSLLMRKQTWARTLATFADNVREAPVLILGTESNQLLLREFFAALFSLPAPHPKTFLYLLGDRVAEDPVVVSLLRKRATLLEINATTKQFCDAVSATNPSVVQLSLTLPDLESTTADLLAAALRPFASYLEVVPNEVPTDFNSSSRTHELVDALFRPTEIDWNPYLFDYHLPRTQAAAISSTVMEHFQRPGLTRMSCFVLRGDAGSGKTCAMKQAATNLAASGCLVLWLKRLPPDTNHSVYRDLSRTLSQAHKDLNEGPFPKIVIFCDEPWNLRVIPHDLAYELNASGVPIALVISFRNTDLLSETGLAMPLPVLPDVDVELSYELDDEELSNLPSLLVRIGAYPDDTSASNAITQMPTRHAADVLCSLWYLVPQTRASLSLALEDEYFRLGNSSISFGIIADAVREFGKKARLAYECVAVCSGFKVGLPTEVLVRVLQISFEEWHEMCVSGKPLWGLIYPDENLQTGEVVYVTRNEIVTGILLRLLNGDLGHTGEHRRLKDLVSSCTVGTPPYRTFLVDLLVRNRQRLLDRFTLDQGIELFELARRTFPHPDKTIEHQFGVWLKDKDADPTRAYDQLQKALITPDYPHATSRERPEHIHTTLAAVILSQVRDGTLTVESGLVEVREHLRYAQTPDFFNPHTSHVFGTLLLDLAEMHSGGNVHMTALEAVAEAIPMIERALQTIGASGSRMLRYDKDIKMLTDLQHRILDSIDDVNNLKQIANEIFDSNKSQIGFEVVARKLLYEASQKNRGRMYLRVDEYLQECFSRCREQDVEPGKRLIAVRVDLYIRWRIQRTAGPVDWEQLRDDLQYVLESPWFRDDMIKMFYLAVALFHTERLPEANVLFAKLRSTAGPRQQKGIVRAYHLGKEGAPKRYQGIVRRSHGRFYMEISELGTDLPIRDEGGYLNAGASKHCYVGFSFFGPHAMVRRPASGALRVPV